MSEWKKVSTHRECKLPMLTQGEMVLTDRKSALTALNGNKSVGI